MGKSEHDPGAETRMFQAFVDSGDRPTDFRSQRTRNPVGLAVIVAAVLVGLVVLWMVLG
jgi:hypothetical protein